MIYKLKYCQYFCNAQVCTLSVFIQLEDVQQAYTMDEIRFEEKYEDLLGRYQSERDTERKEYEVGNNSCTINVTIDHLYKFRVLSMARMITRENYIKF